MKKIFSNMKKLFVLFTTMFLFSNIIFADNICENEDRFIIKWNLDIIVQQIAEYHIIDTWNQNEIMEAKFTIFDDKPKDSNFLEYVQEFDNYDSREIPDYDLIN